MTPLFKQLNLGASEKVLVLNASESFATELAQLEGMEVIRRASPKTKVPFAVGFAATQRECDFVSSMAANATEGDPIVWIAYPKAASKRCKCDFNRDTGWTVLGDAGFEPVRQVAIDEDWSALRFRRTEYIRPFTRSNTMALSSEGKRRTKRQSRVCGGVDSESITQRLHCLKARFLNDG
ncbi:hypothetical protein KHP57_14065 [Algiphilus sp. NNCM1]|nr:hypothetical protein [Algiphilus acroporae]